MSMTLDQEILNATSDDWEALEQIYQSVCLDFSSENNEKDGPNSFYWRENGRGFLLSQVADSMKRLVSTGLLLARREDGNFVASVSGDDVWRCWFRVSEIGREELLEAFP